MLLKNKPVMYILALNVFGSPQAASVTSKSVLVLLLFLFIPVVPYCWRCCSCVTHPLKSAIACCVQNDQLSEHFPALNAVQALQPRIDAQLNMSKIVCMTDLGSELPQTSFLPCCRV